jgi:hypothetical protein
VADNDDKLAQDLAILQEMASQMSEYLKSETLFWPMQYSNMPQLTLGGYWLRQHRLTALHTLLTGGQQAQLSATIQTFETAVSGWVVRTEQRAHKELEVRIRLWGEYLRDIFGSKSAEIASYSSRVEVRAIMAALVSQLQKPPYTLKPTLVELILQEDKALRARWQSGPFVWPEAWQPAYPKPEFWWLYGHHK